MKLTYWISLVLFLAMAFCLVPDRAAGGEAETPTQTIEEWAKENFFAVDKGPFQYAASYAAFRGRLDVLKWMQEQGVDVTATDGDRMTLADIAADAGHVHVLEWLKEQGSGVSNKNASMLLLRAAARGDVATMKRMKEQGADVNFSDYNPRYTRDIPYYTAFGFPIREFRPAGHTPMHFAASGGHMGAMEWLKEQGADVNAVLNNGWTPMFMAASKGHIDTMAWLKEQGADVNAMSGGGWTPILEAIKNNRADAATWLTGQGADINAKRDDGWSPLFALIAMTGRNDEAMRRLIELGADINAKDGK
jgi:cytohesin